LGVERPAREADHSPPTSAEDENVWSYTSILPYIITTWDLIKYSDTFTFFFQVLRNVIVPRFNLRH